MTKEEFSDFFCKTLAEIPAYAYKSISSYVHENGINFFPEVSDENIDKVENLYRKKYSSAITFVADNDWRVLFRAYLLKAPVNVLKTIIWHEAVHAFLAPVFHPLPNQKSLSSDATEQIVAAIKLHSSLPEIEKLKSLPDYDYEESLVVFINKSWGADDLAAAKWIIANTATEC